VFTALAATWAAGFVDATGWMLLSHIYTSNMTGNSISMAVEWIEGKWINAAERAWPVLLFVCGLLLGAIITEFMVRRGKRSFSAVNFAVEFVAIGAFVLLARPLYNSGDLQASGWMFYLLVAMLALGMGVQNQTVTRLGALNIHTTHVTGTLTTFGADTAEFLFWLHDRSHTPKRFVIAVRLAWRQKEFREMVTTLSLWLFFSVGALAAVFATKAFGPSGLFAPMVILAALIVIDLTRPVMASAEAMKIAEARQPRS
jgi:uncharacterized membrane protein YoaK (UPF0700 family)